MLLKLNSSVGIFNIFDRLVSKIFLSDLTYIRTRPLQIDTKFNSNIVIRWKFFLLLDNEHIVWGNYHFINRIMKYQKLISEKKIVIAYSFVKEMYNSYSKLKVQKKHRFIFIEAIFNMCFVLFILIVNALKNTYGIVYSRDWRRKLRRRSGDWRILGEWWVFYSKWFKNLSEIAIRW